jgi:hypothetical protein
MKAKKVFTLVVQLAIIVGLIGVVPVSAARQDVHTAQAITAPTPKFSSAVAFDLTAPLSEMAAQRAMPMALASQESDELLEVRPDRGPEVVDQGYSGDGALQPDTALDFLRSSLGFTPPPLAPTVNFEGISNADNFNLFGFRVNPPDPDGDVGRYHYVEMINLAFAVYDKLGNLLLGPVPIGALWEGFAVDDCTDPSGDPIVLYDQFADRWLLSQFTTRTTGVPENDVYYNCVAISQTGDPTGAYYRYAFTSGNFFPDYPKYGVWPGMFVLTSRDFGPTVEYGISVYALEKSKMLVGDPTARAVQFFLDSDFIPIYLMGDGLLPPDVDGNRALVEGAPAPIVGTMDDDGPYGAPFDALNIWELDVKWSRPWASLSLKAQIPVAEFDSAFPCAPTTRDCLPQPGITNPDQFLDILSYRQRPTWRLAYRFNGLYETMVTNQSVEARPGIAGVRWYEIRRTKGVYSLYQQGTYAPDDGVHRWMGSIATDKKGNMALGYSVVNGTDVFPGIRYTGRTFGAPLGQMNLAEGVIINGSGVQTTTNSRWGDYTSMNIDPVDDCTFWYVNEYYEVSGLPLPVPPPPLPPPGTTAPWQTRIASFRLPGCK